MKCSSPLFMMESIVHIPNDLFTTCIRQVLMELEEVEETGKKPNYLTVCILHLSFIISFYQTILFLCKNFDALAVRII